MSMVTTQDSVTYGCLIQTFHPELQRSQTIWLNFDVACVVEHMNLVIWDKL